MRSAYVQDIRTLDLRGTLATTGELARDPTYHPNVLNSSKYSTSGGRDVETALEAIASLCVLDFLTNRLCHKAATKPPHGQREDASRDRVAGAIQIPSTQVHERKSCVCDANEVWLRVPGVRSPDG